jgi:hypothetical protein
MPTKFKPKNSMAAWITRPLFRSGQSKGWTREFAADSPAFSGKRFLSGGAKSRAVHAQTGKLCRLPASPKP